jgi:hypothetical protein
MNLEFGQRVICKADMKEGTVVSISETVVKVIFDDGTVSEMHHALLAEKLDGLIDDDRQFLIE